MVSIGIASYRIVWHGRAAPLRLGGGRARVCMCNCAYYPSRPFLSIVPNAARKTWILSRSQILLFVDENVLGALK